MEINCPNCSQTLRVGDGDAGKNARCPKCQTIFVIEGPGGAASPDASSSSGSDPFGGVGNASSDPYGGGSTIDPFGSQEPKPTGAPSPGAPSTGASSGGTPEMWHMRIEDGRTFGPVSKAELDNWLAENRVTANCQLRRDNDSNWMAAYAIYPQLGSPTPSQSSNPFADQQQNPYAAKGTGTYQGPQGGYREPHRGVTILLLGIFGILCCCILSIVAVIMGHADLKKMESGQMDPDGRGLTMAGYIIGIIGLVLQALGAILQVIVAVAQEM